MFKIIDYRNSSGKILITIETDDFTAALFLRFMSEADKFAEIFHYRQRIEKNVALIQKDKPERMAHAMKIRAELLKKYKEIAGSHRQRLKILLEMCLLEGMEITQDRLLTKLQIATGEEKLHKQMLIKRLKRKGKSISEIATTLSISKSTVARYARAKGTAKPTLLKIVELQKEDIPKADGSMPDE